jgi:hypothetical protein
LHYFLFISTFIDQGRRIPRLFSIQAIYESNTFTLQQLLLLHIGACEHSGSHPGVEVGLAGSERQEICVEYPSDYRLNSRGQMQYPNDSAAVKIVFSC